MKLLLSGAAYLGIALDIGQQAQFQLHHQALTEWNRFMNLTSVTDWERVQTVHFLDSLSIASVLPAEAIAGGRLLDVGSGAGFPGIPLKLAFPELRVDLVESASKKVLFLNHLVDLLDLKGVKVHHARAEEVGHAPEMREGFDVVVARGVAKLDVLSELTFPFVRVGGMVIAQKKGEITAELSRAEHAVALLGGVSAEVSWLDLPGLRQRRALVVLRKVAPTPGEYPRRSGMPNKRPIHSGMFSPKKGLL